MRTSEDYTNRHAGRWTGSWTHLRTTKKLPHPGGAILFLKLRADGNVMYRLAPSRVVRVVAAWKLLQGCSSRFDLAMDFKLNHHTHTRVCIACYSDTKIKWAQLCCRQDLVGQSSVGFLLFLL